jgi:hypothetical protein
MVVVVEAGLGGVWWMRDGGEWAGAAYMEVGGRAAAWKINLCCACKERKEHQSLLPQLLAARAATSKLTSERMGAIGSLVARPKVEGARALIWKARPCARLIWRGWRVIRRVAARAPLPHKHPPRRLSKSLSSQSLTPSTTISTPNSTTNTLTQPNNSPTLYQHDWT